MIHPFFSLLADDASTTINNAAKGACGANCGSGSINGLFSSLTNALIYLVGAIAVVMIIIGGLRYVLSNGDSKAATDAKNTIMYSVVGVIVAIIAYAIVHFVTQAVG